MPLPSSFDWNARIVEITEALVDPGYIVLSDFLPAAQIERLRTRALHLHADGAMRPAAIGRAQSTQWVPQIRGDSTVWLDERSADAEDQAVLALLEAIRLSLNEHLRIGLAEIEAHYAIYPPGAGYARHLDRHRDDDARIISLVLYLNADWQPDWGGQLRLFTLESAENVMQEVLPRGGTIVLFRSEQFPHEVLPATHTRLSIAAWFRRRG